MIRAALGLVLALILGGIVTCARADVSAVAEMQNGAVIELHDQPGPCVRGAMLAVFVAANGDTIPGCWITRGDRVVIVFLDTDIGAIPAHALKAPKRL